MFAPLVVGILLLIISLSAQNAIAFSVGAGLLGVPGIGQALREGRRRASTE